jgi:hypothetical protein
MHIVSFTAAATLLLLASYVLYRMVRERQKAKATANEVKQAEEFTENVNDTILRSAFPEYNPKSLFQTGDPLLSVTTPDGTRWRVGIDHIYGIEDVAIFPRVFFESPDCRGRRFYADKTTGKVVVNPQEMEGLRIATTNEIKRDIPDVRHSDNYLVNVLFDTLWMKHIHAHLKFLEETRANLADRDNITNKPVRGYQYAPALKAYVPGDVAQVLNKDSVLSALEWPDIYEYHV